MSISGRNMSRALAPTIAGLMLAVWGTTAPLAVGVRQDATPKKISVKARDRHDAAIKLLEQTRAKIKRLRSVQAEFVQKKHLAMLTEPVISKGTFLYKPDRKFAWHYLPPDESYTISDGKKIWLYFPALKQAEVYDMEKFKSQSRVFEKLCLGFERPLSDLGDAFSIELIGQTASDFEVELRPKDETMSRLIARLQIVISKETGLPTRLQSVEKNGDTTSIKFTSVRLNRELADSVFTFVPPKGVKVRKQQRSLSY